MNGSHVYNLKSIDLTADLIWFVKKWYWYGKSLKRQNCYKTITVVLEKQQYTKHIITSWERKSRLYIVIFAMFTLLFSCERKQYYRKEWSISRSACWKVWKIWTLQTVVSNIVYKVEYLQNKTEIVNEVGEVGLKSTWRKLKLYLQLVSHWKLLQ